MRRTLLLSVWSLALVMPAQAQDRLAPVPGARVRITVPSRNFKKQVGTLQAVLADTLVIDLPGARLGEVLRIPLDSVTQLDVSAGRHRQTWRGAGIGFLAGAAVGAVLGPLSMECPSYGCDTSPAVASAVGGMVLGGLGAVVGLGIGAATTAETWKEVPVATLRAGPTAGR